MNSGGLEDINNAIKHFAFIVELPMADYFLVLWFCL